MASRSCNDDGDGVGDGNGDGVGHGHGEYVNSESTTLPHDGQTPTSRHRTEGATANHSSSSGSTQSAIDAVDTGKAATFEWCVGWDVLAPLLHPDRIGLRGLPSDIATR